ncbi:hypothetical protein BDFB_014209, partial [Asbolus verrucosus]
MSVVAVRQRKTTEREDRFLRLAALRDKSTSTRKNIDDNGSNGAVTEITGIMNGIHLCSAMNPDFVWGLTMDDDGLTMGQKT